MDDNLKMYHRWMLGNKLIPSATLIHSRNGTIWETLKGCSSMPKQF
jgi:hypothetical protein